MNGSDGTSKAQDPTTRVVDLARLLHRTAVIVAVVALLMLILALAAWASGEILGVGPGLSGTLFAAGLGLAVILYALGTLVEVGRDGKQAAGLK